MKKSLKILTLVLSLSLICGALIIAAFAGDAKIVGVTTKNSFNLESAADSVLNGYTNDKNEGAATIASGTKLGTNVTIQSTGRAHLKTVLNQKDGNHYLLWSREGAQVSGNPYLQLTYGTNWTIQPKADGSINNPLHVDSYQYYVLDFDFRAPTGVVPQDMWIAMLAMVLPDPLPDNGRGIFSDPQAAKLILSNVDGKAVIYDQDCPEKQFVIRTSEFTHATYIIRPYVIEDGSVYFEHYLYFNGELFNYAPGKASGMSAADYYGGVAKDATSMFQCRITMPTTSLTFDATEAIALDNVNLRLIDKTYNGNLASVLAESESLADWESNLYDADTMPYGDSIAKIGDEEFDSLAKAIAASTDPYEPIELLGDVISTVYINKGVTIDTKGHTCNVQGVNPYMVNKDGDIIWTEESSEYVDVVWQECNCGLATCDETHPGNVDAQLLLNANIWSSYTKDHSWIYTDEKTGTIYSLVGWERSDNGELLTEDDVVDEAILDEGLLELYPIITTKGYAYEYENANGERIKVGSDVSFATVIENAQKGTSVKFLADAVLDVTNKAISISKDLIIDFNGKTVFGIDDSSKSGMFSIGNAEVTFMSSEPGAKVLYGADKGSASFQGMGMFIVASSNSCIRINGEGTTFYAPTFMYSIGGNGVKRGFYIDGGTFIRPESCADNSGLFQFCSFKYFSIKNATFYSPSENGNKPILAPLGNHYSATPDKTIIDIDNCQLIGNIAANSYDMLEVNITNSVIGGNLVPTALSAKPSWFSGRENVAGGTWNIGEGCTIKEGVTIQGGNDVTVQIVDGYAEYPTNQTKSYTFPINTFTTGDIEASQIFTDTTVEITLDKIVSEKLDPVTVTWIDKEGNSLGTTEATPGQIASSPSVSVADGWVNASYNYFIPADTTGEYTVTIDDSTEVKYTAGKVPVYANYDLILHFQLNIYVPAEIPEGISDLTRYHNNGTNARPLDNLNHVINDQAVLTGSEWPSAAGLDDDVTITLTYVYEGQTVSYSISFNAGDYSSVILAGDYSTEMKQAVLSMLKYVEAANIASGKTVSADVANAIANAPVSIENVEIESSDEAPDYSAISEYIDKIELVYSTFNGGVQIRFYKTQKAIDEGATLSLTWNGYVKTEKASDATAGNWPQTENTYGKAFWYSHNSRAYDFDNDFTITVTADDNTVSCEYSVVDYAAAVKSACTTEQWNLIVATLTYGKYAEAVKLG